VQKDETGLTKSVLELVWSSFQLSGWRKEILGILGLFWFKMKTKTEAYKFSMKEWSYFPLCTI